jgi:hypothetical protein
MEQITFSKIRVYVRGVDVPRHDREYFDIFVGERPDESCRVSGRKLIKCPVFDPFHFCLAPDR